ncbi:nitrate/nitrite transporter NrtS [filamentous cyanobacterium LEGE 11480]|uniref:Nitrate/nitrite transporter NrtS n=1 Tax=Romeriopsis navalis LEGE 11480 TaxID=2777977 RepID=A0A928Z3B4_9CYAN|nr:nitrate/nitrite transporter NrtS [Romeriopsis navalis]MBE9030484.1 nitrate/nitrite transporter NrtS [Romeriopsis navalis LEGE 11480]
MQFLQPIKATLAEPQCHSTALRVAIVVGSILFTINHGDAIVSGKMTQRRWISGLLTYCVPYCVSLHGQSTCFRKP